MNIESFYDQYWKNSFHRVPEWNSTRVKRVLEPILGLNQVLDYGCGMGDAYQKSLAAAVGKYTAADVSDQAVSNARARGFEAFRIDPQSSRIQASDASFDGLVCVEVLEHLFDPLQTAREFYRVLKPNGVVVATVPNFGYHEYRLLALLRAQVPSEPEQPKLNRYNGVHIRFFSKPILSRLMRDAGFVEGRVSSFDDASIWDVFRVGGPMAAVSDKARQYLPPLLHLRFLQDVWPDVFAKRLRIVARKPATSQR